MPFINEAIMTLEKVSLVRRIIDVRLSSRALLSLSQGVASAEDIDKAFMLGQPISFEPNGDDL